MKPIYFYTDSRGNFYNDLRSARSYFRWLLRADPYRAKRYLIDGKYIKRTHFNSKFDEVVRYFTV